MNIDTVNRAVPATDSSKAKPSVAVANSHAEHASDAAPVALQSAVQTVSDQQALLQRVQSAAAQIDSYLKSAGRSLQFRVDDDTGRLVVTVSDPQTGETIRQIPSEEALQLARSLGEGGTSAALVKMAV